MKYFKSVSLFYKRAYIEGKKLLLDTLTLTPSANLKVQILRGLIVAGIAFIVDFGMLVVFKEIIGLHYLLAAALSFGLGVVVSYYLSIRWVFSNRKFANRRAEFLIFLVICIAGLGLNLAIIAGMVQLFGIDYRFAKIVSTVVVFFWNFIARKKILY
ncbi:MAG: GtrA family protein [Candidatus Saccharibacteria bacterium]|nr:GtrA family protein [Candidatus Saccharibacteria bacterium]